MKPKLKWQGGKEETRSTKSDVTSVTATSGDYVFDFGNFALGMEESSVHEEEPPKLTLLMQKAFACVLDDCLDKLAIINSMYANLCTRDTSTVVVEYQSLEERFGFSLDHKLRDLTRYKIREIPSEFRRVQRSLQVVTEIIQFAHEEILREGRFHKFSNSLELLLQMDQDEKALLKSKEKNQAKYEANLRRYEENKKFYEENINQTKMRIHEARLKRDTFYAISQLELQYLTRWENTRNILQTKSLAQNENVQFLKIKQAAENTKKESAVHEIIVNYLVESKQDIKDDIAMWKNKYEKDLETYDKDIIQAKVDFETSSGKFNELQQKYNLHKKQMTDWVAYKEEKARKDSRQEEIEWAVSKIQPWFRGIYVRKNLLKLHHKLERGRKKLRKKYKKAQAAKWMKIDVEEIRQRIENE